MRKKRSTSPRQPHWNCDKPQGPRLEQRQRHQPSRCRRESSRKCGISTAIKLQRRPELMPWDFCFFSELFGASKYKSWSSRWWFLMLRIFILISFWFSLFGRIYLRSWQRNLSSGARVYLRFFNSLIFILNFSFIFEGKFILDSSSLMSFSSFLQSFNPSILAGSPSVKRWFSSWSCVLSFVI